MKRMAKRKASKVTLKRHHKHKETPKKGNQKI